MPSSTAMNTLLMQLDSFEAVQQTFELANRHLAEVLSAFEFFDRQSMQLALKHVQDAANPCSDVAAMHVLVETSGAHPLRLVACVCWGLHRDVGAALACRERGGD